MLGKHPWFLNKAPILEDFSSSVTGNKILLLAKCFPLANLFPSAITSLWTQDWHCAKSDNNLQRHVSQLKKMQYKACQEVILMETKFLLKQALTTLSLLLALDGLQQKRHGSVASLTGP